MKKQFLLHAWIATAGFLFSARQASAQTSQSVIGNLTIEGVKQGSFHEENKKEKNIPIIGFEYNVTSPRDQSTGQATGKRQYSALSIIKNFDNSSTQIFQALTSNEVLKTITIELYAKSADGKQSQLQSIRLTNATIVKISQYEGAGAPPKLVPNTFPMEEVSFSFQKIEIQNNDSKTLSTDDWEASR
jgi:type VI secretion system secreted protein Hcp